MNNTWRTKIGFVALIAGVLLASLPLMTGSARAVSSAPTKTTTAPTPTQNWDQNLQSTSRFIVLSVFGGAAVLDGNTGLVWEQAPNAGTLTWSNATSYCVNRTVGGAVGWRLPSVIELKSVQDPSLPEPVVPTSVFTGVQATAYWTATTAGSDATSAWIVFFSSSPANTIIGVKTNSLPAWCVRGPSHESVY
jgi:uncharacterized protein DUF1566